MFHSWWTALVEHWAQMWVLEMPSSDVHRQWAGKCFGCLFILLIDLCILLDIKWFRQMNHLMNGLNHAPAAKSILFYLLWKHYWCKRTILARFLVSWIRRGDNEGKHPISELCFCHCKWQERWLTGPERTSILRELHILAEGSHINGLFVFVTVSQHVGSRVSQPFLPTPSPEIAAKLQP